LIIYTIMITTDVEAWNKYPFHRQWFNKLWLSQRFNYVCGPSAVPVPTAGEYIVRPIYNLHGMGAGAQIQYLTEADVDLVPPGYFWCERFHGEQLTIELFWQSGRWNVMSVFQGQHANSTELFRFQRWLKVRRTVDLPKDIDELWDCGSINIETVGGRIVEVHLRGSPDPVEYEEFIPVWSDDDLNSIEHLESTHRFISSPDPVLGTTVSRLGFYVK